MFRGEDVFLKIQGRNTIRIYPAENHREGFCQQKGFDNKRMGNQSQ